MVGNFLARGMLVGIVASLFCFGFLKLYGEPQVERAIAFEAQMANAKAAAANAAPAHQHDHVHKTADAEAPKGEHEELVSRTVQAGIGLLTGLFVYCTAFGGLFALAFAFAYGRTAVVSPQTLSAVLAVAGFIAIYLVPTLKYPANPPSIGDAETIGLRTALYFVMIAVSIAAMLASAMLKGRLAPRFGDWNATLIAVMVYVALMAIAGLVLPAVNEVPEQFPADVLWRFRLSSIGTQAVMWAIIGLLFGALTQRAATANALR